MGKIVAVAILPTILLVAAFLAVLANLRVARDQVQRLGDVSFAKEAIPWAARNQLDGSMPRPAGTG